MRSIPAKELRRPSQHATAGNRIHYEHHRPEETALYRLVQQHLETFFAQVEAETGAGLPGFVKEEFDACLECGILAHALYRLRACKAGALLLQAAKILYFERRTAYGANGCSPDRPHYSSGAGGPMGDFTASRSD